MANLQADFDVARGFKSNPSPGILKTIADNFLKETQRGYAWDELTELSLDQRAQLYAQDNFLSRLKEKLSKVEKRALWDDIQQLSADQRLNCLKATGSIQTLDDIEYNVLNCPYFGAGVHALLRTYDNAQLEELFLKPTMQGNEVRYYNFEGAVTTQSSERGEWALSRLNRFQNPALAIATLLKNTYVNDHFGCLDQHHGYTRFFPTIGDMLRDIEVHPEHYPVRSAPAPR